MTPYSPLVCFVIAEDATGGIKKVPGYTLFKNTSMQIEDFAVLAATVDRIVFCRPAPKQHLDFPCNTNSVISSFPDNRPGQKMP